MREVVVATPDVCRFVIAQTVRRLVNPAPTTRIWAHDGPFAIQADLLCMPLQRGRRRDVERNLKCVPNMGIFDGKLPSQEYLDAILVRREFGYIKTATAALNYAMRLASIEYHSRSSGQGNAPAQRRKMQVQPPVLAQKEITKGRTAILRTVMVVLRAAAGHEGYVTAGKHRGQSKRARPIGHGLHAARVVRPARPRSRQRH
jgi:hypothetical protein